MHPSQNFHQLIAEHWDYQMQVEPIWATLTGDSRFNDRLPRVTPGDMQDRLQAERTFRDRLSKIPLERLSPVERQNYEILKRVMDDSIREYEYGAYFLPISKANGFHLEFPELFQFVPLESVGDYDNYLARLEGFQQLAADYIGLMSEGIRRGFRPARASLEGIEPALSSQVVKSAQASPLYEPFIHLPVHFSPADKKRLAEAGEAAIMGSVVTGYRGLLRYVLDEYLPAARKDVGASSLPDGPAFYAHRIRMFTSLDLSAHNVHDTGLAEVERIRSEMSALIARTGFDGDLKTFIEFLRTDSRFYAASGEALMAQTALVLKRMDGELPKMFKTLPRMPYGIRAIPEHSAPGNTTAYYFPPAGDGTRAGTYYVNLYDLPSRPLYEIEALSLHEAVPGHHLQIALQQELGDLPNFRRFGGFTAFVEGWALYAERLGLEVGFYQDPYSDFGRLSYEMWRACRLVVDTGLHALGWTRQQAIDFMAEHTSLTVLNITNEVDRYIAWPGQAVAYKIGELKIRELRARAEDQLGSRFNLREFHDIILGSGALPLDMLESLVEQWILAQDV
jgi:uncharacterized protein (DUF885 family)